MQYVKVSLQNEARTAIYVSRVQAKLSDTDYIIVGTSMIVNQINHIDLVLMQVLINIGSEDAL